MSMNWKSPTALKLTKTLRRTVFAHTLNLSRFLSAVLLSGLRFKTSYEIKAVQKAHSNSRLRPVRVIMLKTAKDD